MTSALITAAGMWGEGKLYTLQPLPNIVQECIAYLKSLPHEQDFQSDEVQQSLKSLLAANIGAHFTKVANHRLFVTEIYKLLQIANCEYLYPDLDQRITQHDLSRYGPSEALGFCVQFHSFLHYSTLPAAEKHLIAARAFHHHTQNNSHHPEFHISRKTLMEDTDIVQSLLDIIAHRLLQTVTLGQTQITPSQLLTLPMHYYQLYTHTDKQKIMEILDLWFTNLEALVQEKMAAAQALPTFYFQPQQITQLHKWEKSRNIILFNDPGQYYF